MNEGDSAGGEQNIVFPPAVVDRSLNQTSNIGSAAPISQMSQLSTSRLNVQQQQESQNTSGNSSSGSSAPIQINQKSGIGNILRTQNVIFNSSGTNSDANKPNELVSTTETTATTTSNTVSGSSPVQPLVQSGATKRTTGIESTVAGHQQQAISKKRSATTHTDADSIINYKKRNLTHRINRLKQIKEKYSDHVAEIYFLQTGGNMMEYAIWRKKSYTSDFSNFIKRYPLDSPQLEVTASPVSRTLKVINLIDKLTMCVRW